MERIEHLIEKLVEQRAGGASARQLLTTVQMLHQELLLQQGEHKLNSAKVAVVMPGMSALSAAEDLAAIETPPKEPAPLEMAPPPVLQHIPEADKRFIPAEPAAARTIPVPPVEQLRIETEPLTVTEPQPFKHYALQKPVFETQINPPLPEPKPVPAPAPAYEEEHSPVLMQHGVMQKEVHEVIAEKKESLNEKLGPQRQELASVLKEAPIHDLRKGIGVNDKFLFINELFRSDEDMYQRSIKTINDFRILPEAEYWINRELKVKLGWNDAKDTVQHFYAIVRRRFS